MTHVGLPVKSMNTLPLDPRSVANYLLEIKKPRQNLTNLALQKIVYFLHGQYLSWSGNPLISGSFVAWEFGPVHTVLYSSFKSFGSNPIDKPAKKVNMVTGEAQSVDPIVDEEIAEFLQHFGRLYLDYSAGRLVELSHAPGSPWDIVTKSPTNRREWGMKIDNELIKERFKFHKISVGPFAPSGVPNHDTPPT